MMPSFTFVGEESARFTRFAKACLALDLKPVVSVTGREPLTSRPISLTGTLESVVLDNYIRHIVIREKQSGLQYWVAGSNATRGIAARGVTFNLTEENVVALKTYSESISLHVPRLQRKRDDIDHRLWSIEQSIDKRDEEGLRLLLSSLEHPDERVILEAALTLRAYSGYVVESGRRQHLTEQAIVRALPTIANTEARVALVEDLGYFGSSEAIPKLAAMLADPQEHDHVRWAAAIAIGRLPTEMPKQHLAPGMTCGLEWAQAATLLSLARHAAPPNRADLEPIFCEHLGAEKSPLIIRYACLGLSRFDRLDEATGTALRAVLGDDELPVHVRGYAALAIGSTLSHSSLEAREQTRLILERFARHSQLSMDEPEAVWGVEFLAELASLLELNEVSSALHGLLADNFDDWRSSYYTCMRFYEQGESSARRGLGDEAIHAYQRALAALKVNEKSLPAEAVATLQFRRDIVESRQRLQALLGGWLEAMNSGDLVTLVESVGLIRATYKRYVTGAPNIGFDRQLVDREIAYIKNTSDLVSVIRMLIEFEVLLRDRAVKEDDISQIVQKLHTTIESIHLLKGRFETNFARSLREVVDSVEGDLVAIGDAFSSEGIRLADKLRLARSTMTQIRSAFWRASWPMPGRACPVYGLGRASIVVRHDGLRGSGTDADPLLFPHGVPPVLLVTVRIFEMAPGGGTALNLEYSLGDRHGRLNIPIVEDQHTLSVHLGDALQSFVPVRCDMALVFAARDCTQNADAVHLYLRGEG